MHARRGFIFNDVMVAPRISIFMYTQHLHFNSAGTNPEYWTALYEGGAVYELILYNQVSVVMTHVPNFAHDRLANYVLKNLFEFLSCWTNLQFYSMPPLKFVEKYFEVNPDDRDPIWKASSTLNHF